MTAREAEGGDPKALVRRGYDACSDVYVDRRAKTPPPELEALAARLPRGARVLDIGCGSGIPVTAALSPRFDVTGVDISQEQIARAARTVPAATFVRGDIMEIDFSAESFDAVVAFYSIFHLPRAEQPALFERIARWLAPGGYFLATLSRFAEDDRTEEDFFGVTMFWSQLGFAEYEAEIARAGLDLLSVTMAGKGYVDDEGPPETHPLVLAQKHG